jgi:hypothetical protein
MKNWPQVKVVYFDASEVALDICQPTTHPADQPTPPDRPLLR